MKKTCVFVFILIFGFIFTCYAEDNNINLKEMVVTASRFKEPLREVSMNVQVITEKEINFSSARDLGELLAEKGIGTIREYPGTLTSVGIRGFRTDTHGNDLLGHVLILLDGRRAGTGNLAKILTKNIERIEIIRGPGAVMYGSAGIGGVINVITKKGSGKPHVFLEGKLGSFDYQDGTFGSSGKIKIFDFSFAYSRGKMDDYDTGEGKKYHNTGYNKKENYSLNLGYEFLPGNRIGFIYTKFDVDKSGAPGYFSQNDLDDYSDKSLDSADFIYEGTLPSFPVFWKVRYFQGKDINKYVDPTRSNPDGWDDGIPSTKETTHRGAQAQITLDLDRYVFTGGFDFVYYKIEDDTYSPKETKYKNPAGFILAKVKLLDDKLIVSGGGRYDKYKVEIERGEGTDKDKTHFCPSLGATYLLNDHIKFRANYAKAYRMPSAEQLASDFYVWGTHYRGNPDLDPERSWTVDGGMDLSYDFMDASLGYFYTYFKDKIETESDYTAGIVTYKNHGKAKVAGIEVNLSLNLGRLFDLDFQIKPYGNIIYLCKRKDEDTDRDLKYTERLSGSYGIYLSDKKGFWSDLNFAYHGNQWVDDWESGAWPAPVVKMGGFTVVNFTVGKKLITGDLGSLSIRGEIRNLLDKDYSYVKGYPMPGRSFYIGLRYDY